MINIEQKLVLELLRNNSNKDSSIQSVLKLVDFKKIIDLSLEHRVFIPVYHSLKKYILEEEYNNFEVVKKMLVKNKFKTVKFYRELFNTLNVSEINYIFQKGFSLEYILYGDFGYRTYGDIDILVNPEEFEKTIEVLNNKFNMSFRNRLDDYYSREIKLAIYYDGITYAVEVKKRHLEADLNLTRKLISDSSYYNFEGIEFKSFNNNHLFISLCIYLYNYMERTTSWFLSKKIRLCYFYDLYTCIKNKDIDYNKVKEISLEYECLHKIILILGMVYQLFMDDTIHDISKILNCEPLPYTHDDYFNEGRIHWNINIYDKVFNFDEVKKVIETLMVGKFFIGNSNKNISNKGNLISQEGKKLFDYSLHIENKEMIFKLNNYLVPCDGNHALRICLFFDDIFGEFHYPYEPFSIRIEDDIIHAYNRFTVDVKQKYIKANEKLMSYQRKDDFVVEFNKEQKELIVIIKMERYDIKYLKGDNLGYNIEVINIDNVDNAYVMARSNDIKDIPKIMKNE